MAGNAKTVSRLSVLDPGKLLEEGLSHVHKDWKHALHMYQPCEGLCISCINGRPGSKWEFQAEGPSAFSVNILLEGRMQAAFEDGAVLDAKAGSAILMASGAYSKGWDVFDGQSVSDFRMVNIHIPKTSMEGLIGLQMDDLRSHICSVAGEQANIDAFLGVMPASSGLQRIAYDLLGYSCTYPSPSFSSELYLRAKAFEAIACFLRENLSAQPKAKLPVPADGPRLIAAHALLEKSFDQEWTVQTLARAVGLNEKRLQSGFHARYGCSVYACLTRIRLEVAITLLQRGASVTETAFSSGFTSLSHFSRMFRNHTGISPKQCALGITPRLQRQLAGDAR